MLSSAILKRRHEKGHLCYAPDLSERSLSFLPLSRMLVVSFFIDHLYQVEEVIDFFGHIILLYLKL